MKVKIIRLSKKDAHYPDRKLMIGLVGEWKQFINKRNNWHGGSFIPDNKPDNLYLDVVCFAYVKFEVLEK